MKPRSTSHGFTLIESVVALGIFAIFVVGIYGSIQLSFSLVYHSRVRIFATAILNEQMEIMRNTSFENIGIVNGSPSGIFEHVTTTVRNGMVFEITRTIRNVDDPYDGTIGGTPPDTSPADYKFIQIEARCKSCNQSESLSMYTYIAPKYLEGNLDHGALFIQVIDAYGNPVSGASVAVIATSTSPVYNFVDTTDTSGFLRIYDLPTGTVKYAVEVTKAGYTSDRTYAPSSTNPNPTTPHVTVLEQEVSNITLTIDQLSSLVIETKNLLCAPVAGVPVQIKGARLIGTNPQVFLVDQVHITNGQGTTGNLSLPWDSYGLDIGSYDLMGTIPDVPMMLLPDAVETAQIIVGPNTTRSMVIMTEYQGAPIANATITVTGPNNFSMVKNTGVGSISQSDWSNGPGVEIFGEGIGYSAGSGIDPYTSPGNLLLSKNGGNYISNGYLESSTIDTGENARYVIWSWNPMVESPSTTLRIQIATSASSTGQTWNFVGPDGTGNTYFTTSEIGISAIHNDEQYMRYRVYMDTTDPTYTPILSDLTLVYTNACTPPGQVYLGGLSAGQYTILVEVDGYQETEEVFDVTGDHFIIMELTSI